MKGSYLFAALIVGLAMAGCSQGQPRFKGVEAYKNSVITNDYGSLPPMDPYSYGGVAYATGGLKGAASYGTGAADPYDGDPAHYKAVADRNGPAVPPVDWGDGQKVDTSGYVVPEPPQPIVDEPAKE